mgnify:CR=1 FL=1
MVTLPSDTLAAVDAAARTLGRKRSHVVRQALQDWLDRQRQQQFEGLLAEGYQETAREAAAAVTESLSLQAAAAEGIWRWDE